MKKKVSETKITGRRPKMLDNVAVVGWNTVLVRCQDCEIELEMHTGGAQ